MVQHSGKLDQLASYCTGLCTAILSIMVDVAQFAQAIGMIVGCMIAVFALYRDIVKYMKNRNK